MADIENIGRKFVGAIIGLISGIIIDVILIQAFETMGKPELIGIWTKLSIPFIFVLIGAFHEEINELLRDLPRIR